MHCSTTAILSVFITHADSSRTRKVVTAVCLCDSFFSHNVSKTYAAKITKLDIQMFHNESWKPTYFGVKRSNVKNRTIWVTKTMPMWDFALLWVLASASHLWLTWTHTLQCHLWLTQTHTLQCHMWHKLIHYSLTCNWHELTWDMNSYVTVSPVTDKNSPETWTRTLQSPGSQSWPATLSVHLAGTVATTTRQTPPWSEHRSSGDRTEISSDTSYPNDRPVISITSTTWLHRNTHCPTAYSVGRRRADRVGGRRVANSQ